MVEIGHLAVARLVKRGDGWTARAGRVGIRRAGGLGQRMRLPLEVELPEVVVERPVLLHHDDDRIDRNLRPVGTPHSHRPGFKPAARARAGGGSEDGEGGETHEDGRPSAHHGICLHSPSSRAGALSSIGVRKQVTSWRDRLYHVR